MAVTETKPSTWPNNSQGSLGAAPGNDCRSVFMDQDGATLWALQSINTALTVSSGFSRIRLSDGTALFSGNWNNSNASLLLSQLSAGVPLWIQIGSNYFVVDAATSIVHKMVVSPSSVGSWGNGYLSDVATLNLSGTLGTLNSNLGAFASASVGGVNYIAMTFHGHGGSNLVIVNADSMALVGTWPFPNTWLGETINVSLNHGVFFDKFGKVWVMSFVAPPNPLVDPNNLLHGIFLSTGNPASPSGLTTNFIASSALPGNFVSGLPEAWITYNSSNHSAIVAMQFSNNANSNQAMAVIDLGSLTTLTSRFSSGVSQDIDWWDSASQAGSFSTFLLGIQSDGGLLVPAAIVGTFSPSVSKLNPATLAQLSTVDAAGVVNASSVPDKVPLSLGVVGIASNSVALVSVFGPDVSNSNHKGSPVYILPPVIPPPPPVGNQCVPVDGNGNLTGGTYIQDLSLFILPETGLYTHPILPSAITTSELNNEGRRTIVLDFNNGDGLYARDFGTVFEWPTNNGIQVLVWQPSIIPMPEATYSRATDWDDAGTSGAKFIQGVIVEAFSFGVAKTFFLQDSDTLTLRALNECPATFSKQQEIAFSCIPFVAHSVRLISSDGVEWRIWKSRIIAQPFPELTMNWQTELTSLGMTGWAHVREMNLAYLSTAPVTLTLSFDSIAPIVITLPSTSGAQAKTKITVPPNKWKLIGFQASSATVFRIFQDDIELKLREWGAQGPYGVFKPFGGKSGSGAAV